ncbi:pimeloyl-ACP methyl ester carboxylesterase [Murinocardiopsis flavida]|uniref:Pimeloyl-ACP methyl ester carboxylesterase n=1 Tax=Murinocardiopsis flavida TaxID=645275 RepID=A0A2P8DPB0_9ACTN|nr:alpha/beta fold hydrolase [Murinocardiopsis flavida]PSK99039.1 pimeloyl-ACP methyl ester carboxylesterase [Murinocardiopsis flavida]
MDTNRIFSERRGHGSPLVLLHGLGHRGQAWYPALNALSARHEVFAIDLPGFGRSPAPDPNEPYTVLSLTDTIQEWCAGMGLDRPHLAGNSLGGAIALELAVRGAAASVTALAPIGFGSPRSEARTRLLALGAPVAALIPESVRLAAAGSRPGRALARRVLRGSITGAHTRQVTFDARALSSGSSLVRLAREVAAYHYRQREIACPVTIAWGDGDRVLPPGNARRALRRVPHAHLVVLLGCGHIPVADAPGVVADTILRTCAEAEGHRALGP